ncbi:hypothetical protein ABBQ32_013335 [Trebouxia sp. C0010 RCD-2024]
MFAPQYFSGPVALPVLATFQLQATPEITTAHTKKDIDCVGYQSPCSRYCLRSAASGLLQPGSGPAYTTTSRPRYQPPSASSTEAVGPRCQCLAG